MPMRRPVRASAARAAETVRGGPGGYGGTISVGPPGTNRQLYIDENPLGW